MLQSISDGTRRSCAALDELREMRVAGRERMFVILGPSGVGKSSFLRAGLLPRLRRDDRRFLTMTVVRPQRHALTGETGLARSIHDLRKELGLIEPSLGEIKNTISDDGTVRAWLAEAAEAARTGFWMRRRPRRRRHWCCRSTRPRSCSVSTRGKRGRRFWSCLAGC